MIPLTQGERNVWYKIVQWEDGLYWHRDSERLIRNNGDVIDEHKDIRGNIADNKTYDSAFVEPLFVEPLKKDKEMKNVTIDGKNYLVDLDKCKELGLLVVDQTVTEKDIVPGQKFSNPDLCLWLIQDYNKTYKISGYKNNKFCLFSNEKKSVIKMVEYLNERNFVKVDE